MKKSVFTLVELLVVIAVIGILAGLTLPVIAHVTHKAKQTKARADINSLQLAFSQFEKDKATLAALPGFASFPALNTNDRQLVNPISGSLNSPRYYDGVMEALTCTTYDGAAITDTTQLVSGTSYLMTAFNPKKIAYLAPPPAMVSDPILSSSGFFILDPWGRRYNLAFDGDYDGRIIATGFGGETSTTPLNAKVAVFSYGSDSEDDSTNYICSWKQGN